MNNVVKWLANGEIGASSRALAVASLGELPADPSCHPHDGDDLRRCILLYERAPEEVRGGLAKLAQYTGPWKRLAEHWDELVTIHRSGDYRATTALVRKCINPNDRRAYTFDKGDDGLWDIREWK